ncbi:phosphotransferase [Sphingopyxis sp. NJF-3]
MTAYLASRFPDWKHVRIGGLHRLPLGASRETYRFDLSYEDAEGAHCDRLILRRDPPVSNVDSDRNHEYSAYRAIHGHGIPVPRMVLLEEDPGPMGGAISIAEDLRGYHNSEYQLQEPAWRDRLPHIAEQMWGVMGRLAAVPVEDLDLAFMVPCFGARMDDGGGFALLLEDLAPAAPGDQFRGLPDRDALRAVREAARLHAAFWDRGEGVDLAWLDTDARAQPFYTPAIFRGAWPGFRDRYADRLSDAQRRVCDALAEGYDVYDRPRSHPRCITHNDFRPDNMLSDASRLIVVDWQSVALGCGAVDVAYFIGGSYAPDARRAIEPRLTAAYLDALKAEGVADYSREAFEADYRHFTFAGINVAVGAAMLVQRTERGDQMFLTMLDRHVSHVLDHDALPLLRE